LGSSPTTYEQLGFSGVLWWIYDSLIAIYYKRVTTSEIHTWFVKGLNPNFPLVPMSNGSH
jgi:hypothetical protein